VVVVALDRSTTPDHTADVEAAARLRAYCAQVNAAVDMDARDLAGTDPKRQQRAADRFGELVTFHSPEEIALCSATPPDLRSRDACWLKHDYSCLADIATMAAKSTTAR